MTKLLTQAFEKASELPDDLQDQLATEVIEEIEWESRWDQTLVRSQNQLERIAEKAASTLRTQQRPKPGYGSQDDDRAHAGQDAQGRLVPEASESPSRQGRSRA